MTAYLASRGGGAHIEPPDGSGFQTLCMGAAVLNLDAEDWERIDDLGERRVCLYCARRASQLADEMARLSQVPVEHGAPGSLTEA